MVIWIKNYFVEHKKSPKQNQQKQNRTVGSISLFLQYNTFLKKKVKYYVSFKMSCWFIYTCTSYTKGGYFTCLIAYKISNIFRHMTRNMSNLGLITEIKLKALI